MKNQPVVDANVVSFYQLNGKRESMYCLTVAFFWLFILNISSENQASAVLIAKFWSNTGLSVYHVNTK